MLNLTGPTLCIVASPFQCLCMFEALKHFNITDYDVLVGYQDTFSLEKIDFLFKKKNISYYKARTAHIIKDILPIRKQIKKRYSSFIIADFENRNGYSLACLLAKRNATICYIDDGAQAYQFFSNPPIKKHYNLAVDLVFSFYSLIGSCKRLQKPIYYTVYDVQSDDYKIVKNELSLLKKELTGEEKGVYIIGTNSSMLEFKDYSYFDYLSKLLAFIENKYPGESVFYCPHRRDLNNKIVFDYCDEHSISIFDTEVSVEYDFIEKGINPKAIIGFNSNALYTLHIIYPESDCRTVLYHLLSDEDEIGNVLLAGKLQDQGILGLNLFFDNQDI